VAATKVGAGARRADRIGRQLQRLAPDARLVRENGSFRVLFVAAFGSGIGTWFATVALSIDVFDRTGSPSWVSALLIANFLPAVLVGLALGSLVDRLSRRRLMIAADLVRFATFAALPLVHAPAAIVGLALVAGFAGAFFRPAVLAGVPNVVGETDLAAANGLLQASDYLTTAIGPVAGAALVAASAPSVAYLINAASFLFSAALLARIPPRLLQSEQSLSKGHLQDVREGLRIVVRSPALLTVLVTFSIVMVPSAFMNVAEIALAKRSLHAGSLGFGILWTATGIGLVAGSVAASRISARLGLRASYPLSIAVYGLAIAAAGAAPDIWLAGAAMIVSGVGNGILVVCNMTLVQQGAPDRLRGRAFTAIISLNFVVMGAAMVGAGPLTAWHGARVAYEIAAATMGVATVCGWLLARRIPVEAKATPAREPESEPAPAVPV
jgi:MFS family permease